MANLKEKKNFVGGLDKGSDERYLKEGDYFDALNIRNQSSETNSNGMVQNIKGTTKKSYTYPTAKPIIINGVSSFLSESLIAPDGTLTAAVSSHSNFKEHVSHGETAPKTTVYFLPGSMPAITGFGVNFFASKTTNKIGSDITFPAQAAFRGLTMDSVEGIVDVLKTFETSHKTDLSSRGISLRYVEKGVKISGVDLPCLVFSSTTDSDIFKVDVTGTDVDNGNLKKGINFFVEEFKTK